MGDEHDLGRLAAATALVAAAVVATTRQRAGGERQESGAGQGERAQPETVGHRV